MKLKRITLLLSCGIILTGCKTPKSKNPKNSIIAKEDGIKILYRRTADKIDTLKIQKDKQVSFNFEDKNKDSFGIIYEPQTRTQIQLYLKNGKSNKVTIDSISKGEKTKKLYYRFTGENSSVNHYISLKNVEAQQKLSSSIDGEYAPFKEAVENYIKIRKNQLDSVKDEAFKKEENTTLDYNTKVLKLNYGFRKSLSKKIKIDSIAPEITQLINEKPLEEDNLLSSEGYKNYLGMMAQINFYKKNPDHPEKLRSVIDQMEFIQQYFSNPKIIGIIGGDFLRFYFYGTKDTEKDDEVKAFVNKYITDAVKKKEFLKKLKDREGFKAGDAAPNFSGVDVNEKKFTQDSFKGKYLVIKVWATWCDFCKKEDPAFTKLANQYKNSDKVKFLAISIDEKKKEWEDFMKKNDTLSWQNIWVGKGFGADIIKDYKIKGIPYFTVIDPQGKFALAPGKDTTSKPSKELGKNIEKLLEK